MCAIARGQTEIISELLRAGAKTDLRDDVRGTVISIFLLTFFSLLLSFLFQSLFKVWEHSSDLCDL
jgi:hypothetical protein